MIGLQVGITLSVNRKGEQVQILAPKRDTTLDSDRDRNTAGPFQPEQSDYRLSFFNRFIDSKFKFLEP